MVRLRRRLRRLGVGWRGVIRVEGARLCALDGDFDGRVLVVVATSLLAVGVDGTGWC